jgi:hypothetical protein
MQPVRCVRIVAELDKLDTYRTILNGANNIP